MPKTIPEMIFSFKPETPNGGKPEYIAVTAKDLSLKESWFRDSIAQNPELVILPCEKANLTDEQWFYWDKEYSVNTQKGRMVGKIDVLLISEAGRIGIVETKLAYNPERRRDVLAQILDYAVHLSEMSADKLPLLPKDENDDPIVGHDEMSQHLAEGDFLLIVAGDELDERAVRLSEALLGDHQINPWDFAAIDLSLYQKEDSAGNNKYIIVPTLRKAYIASPRHIVRVLVEGETPKAKLTVERYTDTSIAHSRSQSERQSWDFDKFFEQLQNWNCPDKWKQFGENLYSLAEELPSLTPSFGTGKTGSLTLKRKNKGLIEFYVNSKLRFRTTKFKLALGAMLGQFYDDELRKIFPDEFRNTDYPTVSETKVLPHTNILMNLLKDVVTRADKNEESE